MRAVVDKRYHQVKGGLGTPWVALLFDLWRYRILIYP